MFKVKLRNDHRALPSRRPGPSDRGRAGLRSAGLRSSAALASDLCPGRLPAHWSSGGGCPARPCSPLGARLRPSLFWQYTRPVLSRLGSESLWPQIAGISAAQSR
eukprot:163684-Hanusia_phi.AAC.2